MLADNINSFLQLLLCYILAAAQHDAVSMGNLINEEFAIISGIHLALFRMNYCNAAIHNYFVIEYSSNRLLDIRQLADA